MDTGRLVASDQVDTAPTSPPCGRPRPHTMPAPVGTPPLSWWLKGDEHCLSPGATLLSRCFSGWRGHVGEAAARRTGLEGELQARLGCQRTPSPACSLWLRPLKP